MNVEGLDIFPSLFCGSLFGVHDSRYIADVAQG